MILLIDNYDSFTFNLYQLIEGSGLSCQVRRNDAVTCAEIESIKPQAIVLSPGPGHPLEAGISLSVIEHFKGQIPILGVCLGHQAIGHAFGARIVRAPRPKHGKLSRLQHDGRGLFQDMPKHFQATRYHSLIIERHSLPGCLEISAETEDGIIMGVRHRNLAIEGVQFHPESMATVGGRQIMESFLRRRGA